MEFIRKDELKEMLHNSIEYWKDKDDCTLITLLGVVDDVNKLSSIELIYCQECEYLTPRERLDEPMKSRLPEELIGNCEKTKLYVHENDYCCGAEMRGEE